MAKEFTDEEIRAEMLENGRGGKDFFAARDRLQQRAAEAERAAAALRPVASESDVAAWQMEPSAADILAESKNRQIPVEQAREDLRAKFAADARRLAAFSASTAAEVSEALAAAEAAREKAELLLGEAEGQLSAIVNGFIAVATIRQKISVCKSLRISSDEERRLAHGALDHFVNMKTGFSSTATATGFRAFAEDLAFRVALTPHIDEFLQPLEKQAATLIGSIRKQAAASQMDLGKVFALLQSERTEPLFHNPEFFAGLI
jgi:hypothetical protein